MSRNPPLLPMIRLGDATRPSFQRHARFVIWYLIPYSTRGRKSQDHVHAEGMCPFFWRGMFARLPLPNWMISITLPGHANAQLAEMIGSVRGRGCVRSFTPHDPRSDPLSPRSASGEGPPPLRLDHPPWPPGHAFPKQGFDHVACIHYQLHASPQSRILELIVRRRHQDCVEFGKRLGRARHRLQSQVVLTRAQCHRKVWVAVVDSCPALL